MIIELNQETEEWKDFLDNHEHKIYHTPEFKSFIENTFKAKPRYFAYTLNDEIKTILPVTEVKSIFFGKRLISVAMLEYGGFAGEPQYTDELISHITQQYKNSFDHIEIRQGLENFDQPLSKYQNKPVKRFILPLTTEQELWKNIQKEKRKAINKSIKYLNTMELGTEHINQIYKLYLNNMHAFGTPPYPKRFFINFIKSNLGKCFGSFYEGKLTAFLLGYTYKDRIHVVIANAYPKYLKYRSNDAVHWQFIKWGLDNNYKIFDFGIVREESGQFDFKRKWGAELKDLNKYYIPLKSNNITEPDPNNPKLKNILKIYKKMPVFATKIAGKLFRDGLGI